MKVLMQQLPLNVFRYPFTPPIPPPAPPYHIISYAYNIVNSYLLCPVAAYVYGDYWPIGWYYIALQLSINKQIKIMKLYKPKYRIQLQYELYIRITESELFFSWGYVLVDCNLVCINIPPIIEFILLY